MARVRASDSTVPASSPGVCLLCKRDLASRCGRGAITKRHCSLLLWHLPVSSCPSHKHPSIRCILFGVFAAHISVACRPEAFKVLCSVFWVLIFKCFAVSFLSGEFTLRFVTLRCTALRGVALHLLWPLPLQHCLRCVYVTWLHTHTHAYGMRLFLLNSTVVRSSTFRTASAAFVNHQKCSYLFFGWDSRCKNKTNKKKKLFPVSHNICVYLSLLMHFRSKISWISLQLKRKSFYWATKREF